MIDDSPRAQRQLDRELFSTLALRLIEAADAPAVGNAVCDVCQELFQPDAFVFTQRISNTEKFRRVLAFDTIDGKLGFLDTSEAKPTLYEELADLHDGKPILINLAGRRMMSLGNFGSGRPSNSLMYAPIMLDSVLYGVVSVQSYEEHRYQQSDLQLLEVVARFVAPAFKRVQAEDELHASRERFRRAIEQMNAVPYERDGTTGKLTYAGEGIRQLTGYSLPELTTAVWKSILLEATPVGELEGQAFSDARRSFEKGETRNWNADYCIRAKDGKIRWLRDTGVGRYDDNGRWIGTLGILQDITGEKRNQQLREKLAALGEKLGAATNSKQAAKVVAEAAESLLGMDACLISFYSRTENVAYVLLLIDTVDGERREFNPKHEEPGPIYLKTMREGALLLNAAQVRQINSAPMGSLNPSQSLMFAPIREKGESIGILSVQSYTPGAYTVEDLGVLQLLADYCASALERTRAVEKLRDRDERYRAAIAFANATPYERDYLHDTLTYMGEGIRELTGYSADEMTVALWSSLVQEVVLHGEARDMTIDEAREKAHDGRIANWRADYKIRKRNGEIKWVTDSAIPMRDEEGRVIGTLGILLDITERIQTERLTKVLSRLGLLLSAAKTSSEVAHVLVQTADELMGWDAAFVTVVSPENGLIYDVLNIDCWGSERREIPPAVDQPALPSGMVERVIREGAILIDKRTDGPFIPFGNTERRCESLLYVPIRKGNEEVLGVLSIQSYTPNVYTRESLEFLQAVADHGSAALERTFIEENLRRSEQKNSVLAELARQLNSVRTPRDAGATIAAAARRLVGWDAFAFDLYDPIEDKLIDVLNIDTIDGRDVYFPAEERRPRMTPFGRRLLADGAFMILRTAEELGSPDGAHGVYAFGNKARRSASLMFIPARMGDRTVAMIAVHSYSLNAYTKRDLDSLQVLADYCGGAIERIAMEANLLESEERYKLAAQGANDGLWDWDLVKDRIYYSQRLKAMLGYHEEWTDLPSQWFSRVHPQDLVIMKQDLDEHLSGATSHFQNEHRVLRKDGSYCWMLCRGLAVFDSTGRAVRIAGSMTDVTERRSAEEQLAQAAFYDALTKLANRSLFMDRLEHCLGRAKRKHDYSFSLLFIDIDRFKMVNDSMGHMVGDELLKQISKRLLKITREGDTVARLGGDEFTIILEDSHDANHAMRVADRLLEQFEEPFYIGEYEIFTNASIGIALSSTGYSTVEEMIRDADTALYRAKETGRGRYVMFDQKMHETVTAFINTENGLRNALKNNELRLEYQPIIDLASGRVGGFEALVRWERPGVGIVPPSAFIPVAEDTGMIVQMGSWVLRQACRQMAEWVRRYPLSKSLFMCVNLSPRQFASPSLGAMVEQILDECGLAATSLHVEITETAILKEPDNVRLVVERWKHLGIRVLLDDFGTGYSPLAHLVSFPVDYIKVDRSFVGMMEKNMDCQHIVRAVVSLARIFNLKVIAEGAETKEQCDALRELHCDYVQGYHFSRPLSAIATEEKYLAHLEE